MQLDIENLTNDKCLMQNNYQNVAEMLNKAHLMSTSIEEYVNRRLNRMLQQQQQQHGKMTSKGSRIGSPKNSAHLSSGESGVADSNQDPMDSNDDDLSDESLDTSQRCLLDHLVNQEFPTDETITETQIKIQSKIDRLFMIIEENSKQLIESNSLQTQLESRLEENQKAFNDFKNKFQDMEFEYEEKLSEMQKQITNFESLIDTYQEEISKHKQCITQLEQNLNEKNQELSEAMSEIVNEKNEVSNLECVRKDLEAQRTLLTRELHDTDIKGSLFFQIKILKIVFFQTLFL